jgi:hypothetical protein
MSNNPYTEISHQSWFSRIGASIKGILFGFFLFFTAFPLLWWNEGRSVERYNSLKEGQQIVLSVSTETINPANNGKLIHLQGLADTQETLTDSIFAVSAPAIKLQRLVSMYQWQEAEQTQTYEEVGGTKITKKTYTYRKDWDNKEINSSRFKQLAGHENPPMLYKNQTLQATKVTVGAFKLTPQQIARLSGEQDFNVQGVDIPTELAGRKLTLTGTGFYLGNTPAQPQIGDLQISFKVVKPAQVSLIAQQQHDSFAPYQTQAGSAIDLLEMGLFEASALFALAQRENLLLTWGIRIGGFLLMWAGLGMVLKPLSVFAAVLPLFGNLVTTGTWIFSFLLALPCTMLTIAIAWIAYRPFLAAALIAVAIGAVVAMKFMPGQPMRFNYTES